MVKLFVARQLPCNLLRLLNLRTISKNSFGGRPLHRLLAEVSTHQTQSRFCLMGGYFTGSRYYVGHNHDRKKSFHLIFHSKCFTEPIGLIQVLRYCSASKMFAQTKTGGFMQKRLHCCTATTMTQQQKYRLLLLLLHRRIYENIK